MSNDKGDPARRFRVWIAGYRNWKPRRHADLPPNAVARELAEEGTMSARQAARYVAAYNRASLARGTKTWAVAIPVTVRYEGEPRPGQSLTPSGGHALERRSPDLAEGSAGSGDPRTALIACP